MNNRNGEWCDHAMGWGKADSKGIEDGIRCGKDGKECMMQCNVDEDKNKSVACGLTDEEIEGFAKDMDVALPGVNYHFDEGVSEKFAAIFRDYIRIRKENATLTDSLKDAKMTCSHEKCPFALDELRNANEKLGKVLNTVKTKVDDIVSGRSLADSKVISFAEELQGVISDFDNGGDRK